MESKHPVQISLSFYIPTILSILKSHVSSLLRWIFVTLPEALLTLHYKSCNMSPCKIDIDDQTAVHFWVTNHRQFNKPTLVLIHGFGGNSLMQFTSQVRPLSRAFNLYIPDLLFFGKSRTFHAGRTDVFQAECVREGLRRLGVERYNLAGLSYGGYVAYRMADMYKDEVEKVAIISSGICYSEEQREEYKRKNGNISDLLLPQKPEDVRGMIKMAVYKTDPLKWVPDWILWQSINATANNHRKERLELLEHLLDKRPAEDLPVLTQETLLIWGDQDKVFPMYLAYQLQRHSGPKARMEIIKDTGHAVNMDSPDALNQLITSFVLGHSSM